MHQFKGQHTKPQSARTGGITTQAYTTATQTHSTHSEAGQTLTWARRFQSRHPAPGQRLTSSLLPASHRFILKKFVAQIELLSVSRSCHRGASGRCQGLLHLRWDTPRNLCLPCMQNTVWARLAEVPLWAGDCWRYSVPVLLCESECLGL